MVEDRRAVTVGLDVHKLSVRLAAVNAGEVIVEQTLVHDHEVLVAALGRWPRARVCQEAGPTGLGAAPGVAGCGDRQCRGRAGSGSVLSRGSCEDR
jgi:hypothetical protein